MAARCLAASAPMLLRYLLLILGVFACSTSAVFIRLSSTNPVVLTAARLVVAIVMLSPVLWLELRRHRGSFTWAHMRRTHLPAVVIAAHLMAWTIGARLTPVAQSTLIVNLVPVALPFFLHWIAKERVNRAEVAGTLVAVLGLVTLSAKDALTGGGSLVGNAMCVLSMLLFALYVALARRNRDFPSMWLYMIPVYGQAALLCLVAALPWVGSFQFGSVRECSLVLALAAVPTVCGHSLLNAAIRGIRGQVVSLVNVSQFIFAAVMGYLLFGEAPPVVFYAASAIVVAGLAIVVWATPPEQREPAAVGEA
jgi:drug/metabolite transporter (DMT)-like permease